MPSTAALAKSRNSSRAKRRRSRRFPFQWPVMVKTVHNGSDLIEGTTQNLSIDGVLLCADSRLPLGCSVMLFTVLPDEDLVGRRIPLSFYGRVVRLEDYPDKASVGIAIAFREDTE